VGGQFILFPSFNYKILYCKVTDTGMSFISESTTGGTKCVQYYEECRSEYQYLYNETSVIEIKALRNLNCPFQLSFGKFLIFLCYII
jgi:hypothetical protein